MEKSKFIKKVILLFNFFSKKKVKIGDNVLLLHISNIHEKRYSKSIKNDDYYISKTFIKDNYKVLDLGANIGFTALLYLKFGAKQVYAVEPIPILAKRINNINSNNITVFNYGISDINGFDEIYLSTSHNQGHSLNVDWPERFKEVFKKREKVKIKVATLDSLFKEEIFDFIKIDIEGSETKAILGGTEFFKNNVNAIVQIEIYDWQFEATNSLLSKYYKYVYLPIVNFNQGEINIVELDEFKSGNYTLEGPPNYIYTNKKLM